MAKGRSKSNKGDVFSKKVLKLYRAGVSLNEVSNTYKISVNSLEKILRSQGINLDRDMDPVTKIKKSKIIANAVDNEVEITPTVIISDGESTETVVYQSEYDGVSMDQLNSIIEIMSSGSPFNMTKMAEEMNVPYESLRKIKSDLGLKVARPRKNKEHIDHVVEEVEIKQIEEVEEEVNQSCCTRIYPGKYKNVIRVGMIRNRHDMPTCVKEYIFNRINNDDITNFTKLDSYVSAFILDKVKIKNGVPCKNIEVFATGLQSALGAVTRMCYKYKVNLTLKHYDPLTKKYYDQVIYGDFPIDESELIDFNGIEQIYVHNGMTEDDLLTKEYYAIEAEIVDNSKVDRKFKILHTFMNYEDAKNDYWERTLPGETSDVPENDVIGYKFYKAAIVDSKMVQTKFIHRSSRNEE